MEVVPETDNKTGNRNKGTHKVGDKQLQLLLKLNNNKQH